MYINTNNNNNKNNNDNNNNNVVENQYSLTSKYYKGDLPNTHGNA